MQIFSKSLICVTFALALLASCGGTKKDNRSNFISKSNYINVIPNSSNDSISMYTDDNHIFLYTTDSIGDYVVFYAKFDGNTPGRYDMIKDKIVRVQLDSSLQMVKSITSIHGGVFCSKDDNLYKMDCFDEQLQIYKYKDLNIQNNTRPESVPKESEEFHEAYYILTQLMSAYNISCVINDNGVNGWYYIKAALEPIRKLEQYDFVTSKKIYNNKSQRYLIKMKLATEGLDMFCSQLQNVLCQECTNN